jgi:hypothetical protein
MAGQAILLKMNRHPSDSKKTAQVASGKIKFQQKIVIQLSKIKFERAGTMLIPTGS